MLLTVIGCVTNTRYHDTIKHPLPAYLLPAMKNTTKAMDHLQRHRYDRQGFKHISKERKHMDISAWSLQQRAHNTVFDAAGWKQRYIRWVVYSGISLREASSTVHKDLLTWQNPWLADPVPTSRAATAIWVLEAYEDAKIKVRQSLMNRTSGLTISFDGLKANNEVLELLGIVAHYLEKTIAAVQSCLDYVTRLDLTLVLTWLITYSLR
jgi:hypothetical protein